LFKTCFSGGILKAFFYFHLFCSRTFNTFYSGELVTHTNSAVILNWKRWQSLGGQHW